MCLNLLLQRLRIRKYMLVGYKKRLWIVSLKNKWCFAIIAFYLFVGLASCLLCPLTVIILIPILGLYNPYLLPLPSLVLSPAFSLAFIFIASYFFFSSALLL